MSTEKMVLPMLPNLSGGQVASLYPESDSTIRPRYLTGRIGVVNAVRREFGIYGHCTFADLIGKLLAEAKKAQEIRDPLSVEMAIDAYLRLLAGRSDIGPFYDNEGLDFFKVYNYFLRNQDLNLAERIYRHSYWLVAKSRADAEVNVADTGLPVLVFDSDPSAGCDWQEWFVVTPQADRALFLALYCDESQVRRK
ncbi:MAG TPA: hypothetical protein VJI73_04210 [Candidatus Paceibacterota bacterium]